MAQQFTVIVEHSDGNKIAEPHVTDIAFVRDNVVGLQNPRGDDFEVYLEHQNIVRVNEGKCNLEGATHVYHGGLPVDEFNGISGFLDESEQRNLDVFKE